VQLDILRDGKPRTLTGEIADPYRDFTRGDKLAATLAGALLGDAPGRPAGVAVGTVTVDSPAWQSGLREGDLIRQANGIPIVGVRDLTKVLRQSGGVRSLHVQRGDQLILLARR